MFRTRRLLKKIAKQINTKDMYLSYYQGRINDIINIVNKSPASLQKEIFQALVEAWHNDEIK